MNLRDQIRDIAGNRINYVFAQVNWPTLVSALAEKAFVEEWPESIETRAIRKAAKLLNGQGWVDADVPPVVE